MWNRFKPWKTKKPKLHLEDIQSRLYSAMYKYKQTKNIHELEMLLSLNEVLKYIEDNLIVTFFFALKTNSHLVLDALIPTLDLHKVDHYFKENKLNLLASVSFYTPTSLPKLINQGKTIDWSFYYFLEIENLTPLQHATLNRDLDSVKYYGGMVEILPFTTDLVVNYRRALELAASYKNSKYDYESAIYQHLSQTKKHIDKKYEKYKEAIVDATPFPKVLTNIVLGYLDDNEAKPQFFQKPKSHKTKALTHKPSTRKPR